MNWLQRLQKTRLRNQVSKLKKVPANTRALFMTTKFLFMFFEEKFKALRQALKLQAKEYERRLEALNHEAEQLKNMQATYVSKEVFDRTNDAKDQRYERIADELKEKIDLLNQWKTKQEGRSQLIQYIPWILTAISIVILYTKK